MTDKKPANPTRIAEPRDSVARAVAAAVLPGYTIDEAWLEERYKVGGVMTLNVVSPQLPAGVKVRTVVTREQAEGPHETRFVSAVEVEHEDMEHEDIACAAEGGDIE